MLSLISSTTSWWCFCTTPLGHWSAVVLRPFMSAHGTKILQRSNGGWGRLPYSRKIMVFLTCLWHKCTLSAFLIVDHPLHPLMGKSRSPTVLRNDIWYVCGYTSGGEVGGSHCYPPHDPMSASLCVCWWTVSDLAARSKPQSGHSTLSRYWNQ